MAGHSSHWFHAHRTKQTLQPSISALYLSSRSCRLAGDTIQTTAAALAPQPPPARKPHDGFRYGGGCVFPDIVELTEYREGRRRRLEAGLLLYEPTDRAITQHLSRLMSLFGATSAGISWTYHAAPDHVYTRVVLDASEEPPRRDFAAEVGAGHVLLAGEGDLSAGCLTVFMGSDVTRRFYLVLRGVARQTRIARREPVLGYYSGRILAELDSEDGLPEPDISDEAVAWVLTCARDHALEGFCTRPAITGFARRSGKGSIAAGRWETEYGAELSAVLDAFGDVSALPAALDDLGKQLQLGGLDEASHLAHRIGHRAAQELGSVEMATEHGIRVAYSLRKRAVWDEAILWYDHASALAHHLSDTELLIRSMQGLASLHVDRGALSKARAILAAILELGVSVGSDRARAVANHELMFIETKAGNHSRAVLHGWEAIEAFVSQEDKVTAIFELGSVFVDQGEFDSAEHAYQVAATLIQQTDTRILALDALAYVSALRGEGDEYDRRYSTVAEQQHLVSARILGQLHYYRADALAKLGRPGAAAAFKFAYDFANEHEMHRLAFDAEAGLEKIGSVEPRVDDRPPVAREVSEVQKKLSALREIVVAGGSVG